MSLQQVRGLMAEIGPLADLMAVGEHEGRNVWALRADAETLLFADLDEERSCLILSGDVGTPAPAERPRLNDLLLRYNAHWDETGGVRMAVEGQDGPVVQIVDVPLAGLDAQRLQALVRGFVTKLRAWRAILHGSGSSEEDAGRPEPGRAGTFMIRG